MAFAPSGRKWLSFLVAIILMARPLEKSGGFFNSSGQTRFSPDKMVL